MATERIRIVVTANGANRAAKKIAGIGIASSAAERSVKGLLRTLLTVGAGAGIIVLTKNLGSFRKEMAAVRAISNLTNDEFKLLTKTAKDLGAVTQFSAVQAAECMRFLARTGFDAKEILEGIGPVLLLAEAGMLGVGESADIATNVLKQFRLETSEFLRVVDVLAKGANSANTSVEQLAHALSFVAPIAKGVGVSLEETTAAILALSDAGLQGSRAGTGLRRVIGELESPSDQATKFLRDGLGLSLKEVSVSANGLIPVLKTLVKAALSTGDGLAIFGDRGGPAFEVLASGVLDVERLVEGLNDAGDTSRRMAAIMADTPVGAAKRLFSALQDLAITIGDLGATDAVTAGMNNLAKALLRVSEDSETLLKIFDTLKPLLVGGAIVAGISAITAAIATLGAVVTAIPAALAALGVGLGAISGALGSVPILLAALALIIPTVGLAVKNFIRDAEDVSAPIKTLNEAIDSTSGSLGKLGDALASAPEGSTGAFTSLSEEVTELGTALDSVDLTVIDKLLALGTAGGRVSADVGGSLGGTVVVQETSALFQALTNDVENLADKIGGVLGPVLDRIASGPIPFLLGGESINDVIDLVTGLGEAALQEEKSVKGLIASQERYDESLRKTIESRKVFSELFAKTLALDPFEVLSTQQAPELPDAPDSRPQISASAIADLIELEETLSGVTRATNEVAAAREILNTALSTNDAQGNAILTTEKHALLLGQLALKYRDALNPVQALQRELKEEADVISLSNVERASLIRLRKEELDFINLTGSAMDAATRSARAEAITTFERAKAYENLRNQLDPVAAAQRAYGEAVKNITAAQELNKISSTTAATQLSTLAFQYKDILNPIAALTEKLREEKMLIGLTNDERAIEIQLMQEEQSLRALGIQGLSFWLVLRRQQLILAAEENKQNAFNIQQTDQLNAATQRYTQLLAFEATAAGLSEAAQEGYARALGNAHLAVLRLDNGIGGGILASLEALKLQVADVGAITENIMTAAFNGATDAILNFVKTGEFEIQSFLVNIADMILKAGIQKLLSNIFGGAEGGGAFGSFFANLFGGANAQGNVFSNGSQVNAFAHGGIVGGPTTFPMAGGQVGLMGEEGPESIMPLLEMPNGDLGVQAMGANSQPAPAPIITPAPVTVVVVNSEEQAVAAMQSATGEQIVIEHIANNPDAVKRMLS